VRSLRSRRGVVIGAILLLLVLFLVRPGANRLKARIVDSISVALGRPVDVGSVRARLLPHPGFELDNFVVHDNPTFGAEPMLRSPQVTAWLSLTSLIRGKLEIARLDLSEPSLNLVHGPDGHWNIERLVERAERNPTAPTGKSKSEKRPGFPYIDASSGRINFKFGTEKKPYVLADADFSLWQESENAWGMRLRAQPLRTDFNLTDTGTLQVTGTWQRAARLPQTPLQFAFEWKGAQLGQVTKLAYGNDKGWRGTLRILATLAGTPENLTVTAETSAEDFRRFDVLGGGNLRLGTQCRAQYSPRGTVLSEIACRAPVGQGVITVNGRVADLLNTPTYDLAFSGHGVPMQSVLALARHAKRGIPEDLMAAGQVDADLHVYRPQHVIAASWTGGGQTSGLQLESTSSDTELALDTVPFLVSTTERARRGKGILVLSEPQVLLGPLRVALGRPTAATVAGIAGLKRYDFEIHGDAQLQRILQVAEMLGIPAPQIPAEGPARVDLELAGDWAGTAPVRATGTAQLHAIRAHLPGSNGPLEILSANLMLTPEQVNVQNLVVSAAGASWRGSLTAARPCTLTAGCTAHFDLHANEIAMDRLNQFLNPRARKEPWYRVLSSSLASGTAYFSTLNVSGNLAADRVEIGKLESRHVTARIVLKNDALTISELQGDVLGGRHNGEWTADFTAKPPKYTGSGTFNSIALDELSELMKDKWIAGTATANYRASTSGLTAEDLFASASASLQVDASSGALPHIVLTDGAPPLQIRRLTAHLLLRDGKFDIQAGRLETPAETFHLSGSAFLTQALNLKLTRESASGFSITGTLTDPHVSQVIVPETRAALKQ